MVRRLSIRKRSDRSYDVGPTKHGPTVVVTALTKQGALAMAKEELRGAGRFAEAAARSFRHHMKKDGRAVDTRTLAAMV